jgi:hypothetical protein
MRAIWHSTASKERSASGSAAASPCRQSMPAPARRATVSIASLRSTPVTCAAPARSAATRATIPVPQATSSTVWPAPMPAASHRIGAHWAKKAGTNVAS